MDANPDLNLKSCRHCGGRSGHTPGGMRELDEMEREREDEGVSMGGARGGAYRWRSPMPDWRSSGERSPLDGHSRCVCIAWDGGCDGGCERDRLCPGWGVLGLRTGALAYASCDGHSDWDVGIAICPGWGVGIEPGLRTGALAYGSCDGHSDCGMGSVLAGWGVFGLRTGALA